MCGFRCAAASCMNRHDDPMGTPVNAAINCWIGFSSPMSSRGSRHRAPPGAAAAAASGAGKAMAQRKGPKKDERSRSWLRTCVKMRSPSNSARSAGEWLEMANSSAPPGFAGESPLIILSGSHHYNLAVSIYPSKFIVVVPS